MGCLRRHRDFLAWLMSVAVSCNIILAMVCCAPVNGGHGSGRDASGAFAGSLCISGSLTSGPKSLAPDGEPGSGHKALHSDCVLCAHATPGVSTATEAEPSAWAIAQSRPINSFTSR